MSTSKKQLLSKLKEKFNKNKFFPDNITTYETGKIIDKEEVELIYKTAGKGELNKRSSEIDNTLNNSRNHSVNDDSKIVLIKSPTISSHNLNSSVALVHNHKLTNLNKLNGNKNSKKTKNSYNSSRSFSSADSNSDVMSIASQSFHAFVNRNENLMERKSSKMVKLNNNGELQKSFEEDKKLNGMINNTFKNGKSTNGPRQPIVNNKLEYEISLGEMKKEDSKNFRLLTKREKIWDTDSNDEGSDYEKDNKWIIMPENKYKQILDIIIACIIIYSAVVLPYKIAFTDADGKTDDIIDNIFNSFLVSDIIVSFFTAYVDDDDNLVKNRKKIALTYLKTWFFVDFISVFPINYITDSNNSNQFNALARLGRLPKLYRLIRLAKLLRIMKILKKGNVNKVTKFFLDKLKVNANLKKLVYFVLGFLLLNHIAACVWYFVAKLEDLNPECWVTRLGYIDASDAEIYIVSFYWTLTTVTTVGYGDINAGTTIERMYNLLIMSFGVLMYSFAIGSLSSIVSTLDAKTAEMNQKLQILSSIKKEFSLDQDIYDKVRKVIKYDISHNQKDKMNFLQELPNKLRIELSQIMHDSVIQKMYFFKEQPSDFIAYVAPLLKPVKFSQNEFLYKEGDMIDEMYFVSKGTISFALSKNYHDREVKEIKKHNNFGEIEMCLNEKLTFNIKVKSRNSELFVLKKNDFLRLSVNFKEFIEKFLQKSLMIYLRFNDEKKKIIRQTQELNRLLQKSPFKNNNTSMKNEKLEMIDEKEEEEGSEEYDIYADHSNSEYENSQSELSKENSYVKDQYSKNSFNKRDNFKDSEKEKNTPYSFKLKYNSNTSNDLNLKSATKNRINKSIYNNNIFSSITSLNIDLKDKKINKNIASPGKDDFKTDLEKNLFVNNNNLNSVNDISKFNFFNSKRNSGKVDL